MTERAGEIVLIGAEDDGSGPRQRDRCPPDRCAAARQRIKDAAVRHDDQSQGTRVSAAEPGPIGWAVGDAREIGGHGPLRRPRDRGYASHLDGRRRALKEEGED
jgi:hypothetical protein